MFLPPPPPGKTGFPWTDVNPPQPTREVLPRITVVTPSYNQGRYIEETIRSVLQQNYPNLEYIIMDGGSTDETLEIIQRYSDHLSVWVSEPDSGQTNAINKGFDRSTGDLMGWLNSDDILLPGALHRIARAFMDDPTLMVTCGFRHLINAESDLIVRWTRGIPDEQYLKRKNCIPQETAYWRRDVWDRVGPLDEDLRFGMDYEYWQRMLANGITIRLLPYYVGGFRWHSEAKSSTMDAVNRQELAIIYQRYHIGHDEQQIWAEFGSTWGHRFRLIKDLCHTPLMRSPRLMLWLLRVLQSPLGMPLVKLYQAYRRWRPGAD